MLPKYETKLKREGIKTIEKQLWNEDREEQLRFEYESTEWANLMDPAESLDRNLEVITDYILFVQDIVIPRRTVKIFPNEKPWISKNLKAKVLEKNKLFKNGNIL